MEQSAAHTRQVPFLRRVFNSYLSLDVRTLAKINVEDMALAGGYFLIFWLLDAVNLTSFDGLKIQALASAWPAIAIVGCAGVLFRRSAPTAMAWMCGLAAVGLLFAGHAGAFLLMFEFFFSLVLFGSPKAATAASRTAWVLTALAVVAAFAASSDPGLSVVAGLLGVITFLTPVEWAGNLRKATQLAESESARADAVHEAGQQRLLAERNANDLALEHERQGMARELHDVISARLSAIALQSGAALHAAGAGPSTTLLRQIRQESVSGLAELNTMIRLLHSGASAEAPGRISDVGQLVEGHRGAGMDIVFKNSIHDDGHHLPLSVQTALYRIVAESLANAAKHAPGQPVDVSLAMAHTQAVGGVAIAGKELVLMVRSPLPAVKSGPSAGTGTGIPSMQFRAAHAGGTLTAAPLNTEWVVELHLPLSGPADPAHDAPRKGGSS